MNNVFETRSEAGEYIIKHKLERDYEIIVWKDREDQKMKYSVLPKPKVAIRRNRLKRKVSL